MIETKLENPHAGPLARWYAEPMMPEQARSVLEQAWGRMHLGQRSGQHSVTGRLQVMVARHWLDGAPQPHDYDMAMRAGFRNRRARALAELVYGQLLLSRKLAGAFEHMDAGFLLAAPLLKAEDYLEVRRRHILLRRIVLGPAPASARGLGALMVEAAVIARLEGRLLARFRHDPCDTWG